MQPKKSLVFLIIPTILLILAAKSESSGFTTLESDPWVVSYGTGGLGELNPPLSKDAILYIGANYSGQDGYPDSKGSKKFVCGEKGKCEVQFSIGVPGGYDDTERLVVQFSGPGLATPVPPLKYGPQSHTATQKVTLPGCGEITVEVTIEETTKPGDPNHKPNIQSRVEISPLRYRCCS